MSRYRNAMVEALASRPRQTWGYEVRDPYAGESDYFRENKHVAGMATEDGKITLNPFSNLNSYQKDLVASNEAARLFMFENEINPMFMPTPKQRDFFRGTPYEADTVRMNQTILSRLLTGDPSVGQPTEEQSIATNWLRRYLESGQ